jgi:hypothetical protein
MHNIENMRYFFGLVWLASILPMSQIFGAVSFRSASTDLRLWLDKPNSRCRPAREGREIGKPVEFRRCPRNGSGECVTAKDHWGASLGKVPNAVRKDQLQSPETSL